MSHPPPLVTARPAQPTEMPRTAAALVAAAEEAGWRCCAQYAHGTSVDPKGHPSRLVESLVVRLRREEQAAVAAWHDGKFSTAYRWSATTAPERIGARDLNQLVKETK